MTPQELKNSILQRAIQGKLVEQRPEEGTAEELYQQIQEEKQRLIAEGKIKKEKPLPEITEDEIPFEIPESWKWVRLGSILNKLVDGTHRTPKYTITGVPFVSVKNISSGTLDLTDTKFISEEEHQELCLRCKPEKGDILLSKVGTTGVPAIVDTDIEFSLFVSVALLKFSVTLIYNQFLVCAIQTPDFQKQCKLHTRGVGNKNWVMKDIANTVFPLPPLAEQKRIVAKIEKLLPYIDRYEQAWSRLEEFNKRFPMDMQKSILQYAIQGKLVEQRPEEGTAEELYQRIKPFQGILKPSKDELNVASMDFEIPDSWIMVELNQLFNFVDYRGKTPTKMSEGVFLITASNIKQGSMDYTRKEYISKQEYEGRKSRGVTKKGDLLFTTEAPMGNVALCDLEECSCGQRIITFQEYQENTALPALFMYFILSPSFQKQLLDNCTGTTAKGIKADKLKHFLLPLPPFEEQKRIVARLEELLPLCERLK